MTPEPPCAEPPPPAAGGEAPTEKSGPPADNAPPQAPPAVAEPSGVARTVVPESRNGLGGGILPALVLLLLVPLVGGPGRERALQPQGSRAIALAPVRRGLPDPAVGATVRSLRTAAAVGGRPAVLEPAGSETRAEPDRPVRRGSPDPAVDATARSPRTASAASARPTVLRPAGSETRAERDRLATHRMGRRARWPHPGASGFQPPDCAKTARQNDPKLDASRVASRESSFGIAQAVSTGLRPRDSPGLRGPPP
jgi:hypothetical protein